MIPKPAPSAHGQGVKSVLAAEAKPKPKAAKKEVGEEEVYQKAVSQRAGGVTLNCPGLSLKRLISGVTLWNFSSMAPSGAGRHQSLDCPLFALAHQRSD